MNVAARAPRLPPLGVALALVLGAQLATPVAMASTTSTTGPTSTRPSVSLIAGPQPTNTATTWPVEDLVGPVEDLRFGFASADGAVEDLADEFRLAADVLFAFDRADLNGRARTELSAIADQLKEAGTTTLRVTGYTDSQGSDAYNLALSRRRAAAVSAFLEQKLSVAVAITSTGKGEADPIVTNDTKVGQARNRRVVIQLRS